MAPPLRPEISEQIVRITRRLAKRASFRAILLEANKLGVITDHRTLRRYVDLLLRAEVLAVRMRDVHSVNLQQLYTVQRQQAHLWTGLTALQYHGLSWDSQEEHLSRLTTDTEAMLRSRSYTKNGEERLITGLEDSLIQQLKGNQEAANESTELIAAILATKTLDLAYLLRRADRENVGSATRTLFKKVVEAFTSLPGEAEGRTFLAARDGFLKILRYYNSKGWLKLLELHGKGSNGLKEVNSITQAQIIAATSKQLGISG